jgi:hypothetical protein
MGRLRSGLDWFRALIERKLGVCPYCMRASALGSIIGWLLFAVAWLFLPSRSLQILLLVGASAFTLLISAHLVAYLVRVGLSLRERDRIIRSANPAVGQGLARREFLALVLKAGAYALAVALFPGARVAQAANCVGNHDVSGDPEIAFPAGANTYTSPRSAAEAGLIAAVKAKCDALCAAKTCDANPPTCLSSGVPVRDPMDCTESDQNPGFWRCTAIVKQCPCKCFTCVEQKPPPPGDFGYGIGADAGAAGTAAEADADAKCKAFCEQIKCSPASKVCKSLGKTLEKKKPGKLPNNDRTSRAGIRACQCACRDP